MYKTGQRPIAAKAPIGVTSLFGRTLLNLLSPGKSTPRLSILIYHRVLPHLDPLFPGETDANTFDRQLAVLKTYFNILPLSDAVKRIHDGSLPPRTACITFDDGYADNAEIALPLLKKHGLSATFFVATGFLDGGRMWNDTVIELVRRTPDSVLDLTALGFGCIEIATTQQRTQAISALLGQLKYLPFEARQEQIERLCTHLQLALPTDLMMTSGQVRNLHNAGMDIGAHTVNHPILARVDTAVARREIENGKETLENIIGAPVRLFAYPNGKPGQDYLSEHVTMVKSLGFDAAVSTAWGAFRGKDDLYQLPRFTPWDKTPHKFMLRMAQNLLRK